MSAPETIRQAVRRWLKSVTGLHNDFVLASESKFTAPNVAYLTVKTITGGVRIGVDETIGGVDGNEATIIVTGLRRATVSIQGFGSAAYDHLETAEMSLSVDDVTDDIRGDGFTFSSLGSISDIAELVNAAFEPRFLMEIEVIYRITSNPFQAIRADLHEIGIGISDTIGGPDVVSFSIDGSI